MAGDWIKMRVDIFTSPKVIRISSALKADRLRTVGGLLSAWCLFDVHSESGFLPNYTKKIMDELVGLEGLAEQMEHVGWLIEDENGLTMPRFDEHNGASAKRRANDQSRKRVGRQAEKEAKKSNTKKPILNSPQNVRIGSGQVADKKRTREEKRREENNTNSNELVCPATKKRTSQTGTRLPDDWRPGQEHVTAAKELNPNYSAEWFKATAHQFKDHWIAKSGKDATKTNWLATWRNWVRNDLKFNRGKNNAANKQLDNDSTEWVDRVFGSPASGDFSEQDFSFLEGDFSSVVDTGSGQSESIESGMVEGPN